MELKKYKVIHNSNYYNIGDIVKAKLDYSGTDIRIYDNGSRYARSLPIEWVEEITMTTLDFSNTDYYAVPINSEAEFNNVQTALFALGYE